MTREESMRRMGRKAGMTPEAVESIITAQLPTGEQLARVAEVIHRLTGRCVDPMSHGATESLHGRYYLNVAQAVLREVFPGYSVHDILPSEDRFPKASDGPGGAIRLAPPK